MNDEPTIEADDETQDAWPMCTYCMKPCDPKIFYCPTCNSNETINPLASYMPFVDLKFRIGFLIKLWQKCFAPEVSIPAKCLYFLVLLFLAPIIVIVGIPFLLIGKISNQKVLNIAGLSLLFFYLLLLFIYALFIYEG